MSSDESEQIRVRSGFWLSFTILSPHPPNIVRDRIAASLTTDNASEKNPFRGTVDEDGLRVARKFVERNWLPAVVDGQFVAHSGGTAIQAVFRPRWWIILIYLALFTSWAQLLWERLVSDPLPGGIHWGEMVVLTGFLASGPALLYFSCLIEQWKYQVALTRIVAPDSVEQ